MKHEVQSRQKYSSRRRRAHFLRVFSENRPCLYPAFLNKHKYVVYRSYIYFFSVPSFCFFQPRSLSVKLNKNIYHQLFINWKHKNTTINFWNISSFCFLLFVELFDLFFVFVFIFSYNYFSFQPTQIFFPQEILVGLKEILFERPENNKYIWKIYGWEFKLGPFPFSRLCDSCFG